VIADVAIRLATPADAPGIALLSRDLIEYGLHWGWRTERVARAIANPNTNVAIVGPPEAPIAFGIMEYREEHAHLVLFAVRTERQRQGIGSAVLLWLEAVARTAGAQRIQVEARRENLEARSFYNEHGYHERVIDKAMYGGRVDGVLLEKWLRVTDSSQSDA
jgi:ribosomal protein S18 acetylase RimI-like enzyme